MKFLIFPMAILTLLATVAGCATKEKQMEQAQGSASVNSTPILWTAKESVNSPESAYYDQAANILFVSNVNGNAGDKDGNGYISKYTITGQLIEAKWEQGGLNAPKGLR